MFRILGHQVIVIHSVVRSARASVSITLVLVNNDFHLSHFLFAQLVFMSTKKLLTYKVTNEVLVDFNG